MPFHRFEALPQETISPHYSTAAGGTVTGEVIEVGKYGMKKGTGADHFPSNIVHEVRALEDSEFLSSKNLVDGRGSRGWSAAAPVHGRTEC